MSWDCCCSCRVVVYSCIVVVVANVSPVFQRCSVATVLNWLHYIIIFITWLHFLRYYHREVAGSKFRITAKHHVTTLRKLFIYLCLSPLNWRPHGVINLDVDFGACNVYCCKPRRDIGVARGGPCASLNPQSENLKSIKQAWEHNKIIS